MMPIRSTGDSIIGGNCGRYVSCYRLRAAASGRYDKYQPGAKKNEPRKNQTPSIEKFAISGKERNLIFGWIYGNGHCGGRLLCVRELELASEDRPKFAASDFAPEPFEVANFHYTTEIQEGARMAVRLVADNVKKPNFDRIEPNSADGKGPRWEYKTTLPIWHSSGFACFGLYKDLVSMYQERSG